MRIFAPVFRSDARAGHNNTPNVANYRSSTCIQMLYPGQRVQVDVKYMPKIKLKGRPEVYREYQYTAQTSC